MGFAKYYEDNMEIWEGRNCDKNALTEKPTHFFLQNTVRNQTNNIPAPIIGTNKNLGGEILDISKENTAIEKLNLANIMAMELFKEAENVNFVFNAFNDNEEFTMCEIYCSCFELENFSLYRKFLMVVDQFLILPVDENTVGIFYIINTDFDEERENIN